jgi:alpha-mannosidase
VIEHAAGPMVPTPSAQELGPHRFEYALLLHAGDWRAAGLERAARAYATPPCPLPPGGTTQVPTGRSLVEVGPAEVSVSALYADAEGALIVRLLNASPDPVGATVTAAFPITRAVEVDPLERPRPSSLGLHAGRVHLELAPWQIRTLRLS